MLNIHLYFEDNNSFGCAKSGFQHFDSLAKTLLWLYSEEADGPRDQFYNLDGKIKLYQLMNVILLLTSHSMTELGEATVKEMINDMEKGHGNEWCDHHDDIREFTNQKGERGLSIKWATYELIMDVLWGACIYCQVMNKLEGTKWQRSMELMNKIMLEESGLKSTAFKNNWLVKHTDEMVGKMLSDIEERKKNETKKNETHPITCSAVQDTAELKKTIKLLEKKNKILENKVVSLESQLQKAKAEPTEEEQEVEMLNELESTPVLKLLWYLMQLDGGNVRGHGKKKPAQNIMSTISKIPFDTTKKFWAKEDDSILRQEELLMKMNHWLEAIGMKFRF